MFLLKTIFLFSSVILISFPALTAFTSSLIFTNQEEKTHSQVDDQTERSLSSDFYLIEHRLQNEEIDKEDIVEVISNFEDEFERKYLSSLLLKRDTKFGTAYSTLNEVLTLLPAYYNYYDELVFNANASDQITDLKTYVKDLERNNFSDYLNAKILFNEGKYEETLKKINNSSDDHFNWKLLKSYTLRMLGKYDEALNTLAEAETNLSGSQKYLPKILVAKGALHFLSGDYETALRFYNDGLTLSDSLGINIEKVRALTNIGAVKDLYGEVYEAQELMNKALNLAQQIENLELQAFALSELGVSYTYSGEILKAIESYLSSYEKFKIVNNKNRLSYLSGNLGAAYSQISNYKQAIKYYSEGLEFAGDNVLAQIINLTGLGDVYANLSNYSKALKFYKQASDKAKEINDVVSDAKTDIGIGTMFYNIGEPGKALKFFGDASRKVDPATDPYTSEGILFKTGLVYLDLDSLGLAMDYLKNSHTLSKEYGDIYYEIITSMEIARGELLLGNISEAKKILNELISLTEGYQLIQLSAVQKLYLGKVYSAEESYSKANELFAASIKQAKNVSDLNTIIEAEYLVAKNHLALNNKNSAEKHFKNAINHIEKVSYSLNVNNDIQISHFSNFNDIYNGLAEFYLDKGENQKAFEIIENSRSRNTFQNLVNLKLISSLDDEEKLNKIYELDWMINSGIYSGAETDSLSRVINKLKDSVSDEADLTEQNLLNEFDHKTFRERIKENENLVSVFVNGSGIYFFVMNQDKFEFIKSDVSKEELESLISNISPFYKNKPDKDIYYNRDLFSFNSNASFELYDRVLKPVIEEIPEGEKIIFSLPSSLAHFPVEFLVTEPGDESSYYYNDKKFLVERNSVSYSPSLRIYTHQLETEKRSSTEQHLLVGDPVFNNSDYTLSYRGGNIDELSSRNLLLNPLRFSKDEIEALDDILANNVVLLSDDATEQNFKENAPLSSIIHLSTHSFLYKEQPLVLFSQMETEDEDGFLETGEILQMKLSSDLVVLSSCRSGLGTVDEAEGVLGMQKSFFDAGAKSVVVSLWDVSDKYTSIFMKSFYEYLSKGLDKDEALQKAKISFKEDHSANPYYWAAFVLAGNTSSIALEEKSSSTIQILLLLAAGLVIASLLFYGLRRSI